MKKYQLNQRLTKCRAANFIKHYNYKLDPYIRTTDSGKSFKYDYINNEGKIIVDAKLAGFKLGKIYFESGRNEEAKEAFTYII